MCNPIFLDLSANLSTELWITLWKSLWKTPCQVQTSGKYLLKIETAKRPRIRNLIGKSYKHEKELLWITFS